ncbi:MAG: RagB/SusD family nutrient uptake outer membrane protein [Ferruginibacter sp.]|nr:RagB/SusD family nutrient uptake outer membrane protein [Ferruginibacter sp.]MBU9936599.1 RagB/SusD family nutrient uptake outer membrane protein [Ferruginibacter sp.]
MKYIISLGFCALLSVSCKKELLTPVPQTSITDATAFDSPERVLNQARSLYQALKNGNFYGGRFQVYGDIRADDFINETTNGVTGFDVWNLNPLGTSQNSVKNLWSQAYFTINLCNLFIDGMATKGTAVVGGALSNNYLGEARLIRALSYYSLLQLYARPYADGSGSKPGLPLRLTGIKGSGYSDLARSTVAEVYTQILNDLNFAETNLPLTNATAELNTTRAHRNTAIALKTRVYLSMQNYTAVITEGNKLASQSTAPFKALTGVADSLQPNITTIFGAGAIYNTTESIFSLPMTSTAGDNPGTQNQLGFYFVRNGASLGTAEYSMNVNGILANPNWSATDVRKTSLVYTNVSTGKKFVSKYQSPSPYLDYAPVIRYAEVMLNLAEALARTNTGVDAKALALVNAVRKRSDPATTITAANQQALIDAIMLERRIEFLGEGLRNNDIMRLLQTIPAKGSVAAKTPSESGYIWPISSDEMSLNRLMTDN